VKHFATEDWIDFAHGLAGEQNQAAMRRHLDGGCRKCEATVAMLQRAIAAAKADAKYDVPDYAVRSARAIFALQRPEKVHILPKMLAKLVFDSFREPAMAGVRSQHKITRQAMYEAGDYCVDLRMEHEHGSSNVVLVGQIADRQHPEKGLGSLPVVLMSGKEVIGRAISNGFGEFQIEYQPKKSLSLHVPVETAGKQIEVPLKNLLDSGHK